MKNEEKFFHAIIHLIFTMLNADVRSEVQTAAGRLDTVVMRPHRLFLFEFKMENTAKDVLAYLKTKDYVASLRHFNKPILGIGVVFSKEKKGIADWDKIEL